MEIYLTEIEPLREAEGMLPSLVIQVISKAEISKMTKNGGNALGLKEVDGPLLCECFFFFFANPTGSSLLIFLLLCSA